MPGMNPALAALFDQLLAFSGLPEPLPAEPFGLLQAWWHDAHDCGRYTDANAMTLASCTIAARPSARIVLCKALEPERGALVFYTNYESRKGTELDLNPWAAAVFHWPHAHRQVRIEGSVARISPEESDRYFASRPLLSRLGAWTSRQSRPLERRSELVESMTAVLKRFNVAPQLLLSAGTKAEIPRPPHWGGFRLEIEALELWCGGGGRLHDRAVWTRERTAQTDGGAPVWKGMRLQP